MLCFRLLSAYVYACRVARRDRPLLCVGLSRALGVQAVRITAAVLLCLMLMLISQQTGSSLFGWFMPLFKLP